MFSFSPSQGLVEHALVNISWVMVGNYMKRKKWCLMKRWAKLSKVKKKQSLGNTYQKHSTPQYPIHPSQIFAYFYITNCFLHLCQKTDKHLPFKYHQYLLNIKCITLSPSDPIQPLFPIWYSPNEKCEYHDGIFGHSTGNHKNFKISSFISW